MRAPLRFGLSVVLGLVACGGEPGVPPTAPHPRPAPVAPRPPAPADALGPKPEPSAPAPFTPPVPVVYDHARGMKVWLLERHALPIVSTQCVIRTGASSDPREKGGLAWVTANMLDEGAGKRGPLEIARDLDRLGATLATGAYPDYSFAHLTVLKKNLAAAAAIYGDVLGKPTFSPIEWARVHNLWKNDLEQRKSDPSAVAAVVVQARVFGSDHVYGHPTNGTTKSAAKITLADVKSFYEGHWRPDFATCVVVGDVTRAEIDPVLDSAFAAWKPANFAFGSGHGDFARRPGRRVVVVDRPDAPQSVIAVGRRGVAARDAATAPLTRVNAALGGSFTSRLNQDLREEHGWSYGARSRFSFNLQKGIFVAQAAVHTEHTGDALKAMLADIDSLAKDGLTDDEVDKTRLLARSELVEAFEGVESAAARLARNAGVGLPADHEAKTSLLVSGASKADLARLAKEHLDLTTSTIVVVGPRAKVEPQLRAIGIDKIEAAGPEGEVP
jgi:zinc protease